MSIIQFPREFIQSSLLTSKASLRTPTDRFHPGFFFFSILLSLTLLCYSLSHSLALHFNSSSGQVLSWWINATFLGGRQKGSLECSRCKEVTVCFTEEWVAAPGPLCLSCNVGCVLHPHPWQVPWDPAHHVGEEGGGCLTGSEFCL